MLTFLLILAAVIALSVLPIMFVARAVGAQRTTLGWVIIALLVLSALSAGIDSLVSSEPLGYLIAFLGGGAIFAMALETSFVKGLVISVVSTVISLIGVFLLATTFA